MNKERFTFLIVASSLGIIGLIAIQLYWINISLKNQQEQFDQRVMSAMQEVVKKLEKEEAITKVTSQILEEDTFSDFEGDSTISLGSFPFESSLSKETTPENLSMSQGVRTDKFKLNIELPTPSRNDSSTFIMRETQKRVINSRYIPSVVGDDSLVKNQLKRKATLINEIVNELAFIRISNNFNERVDSSKIDSLFKNELLNLGIKTSFYFDILDAESNRLSFHDADALRSKIMESDYSLQLFPNDYFIKSDVLLLYFPDRSPILWIHSWEILLISLLIVLILSWVFYSSLSTIFKQKKLSIIKNDFINNMTHELKTPISTIALATEALSDESLQITQDRRKQYIGMISEENNRLSLLVDNVLKSAVWDSSNLKLNLSVQPISPLIEKVVNSFKLQLERKDGTLKLEFEANDDCCRIDEVHFINILFNLLDNANKYSRGKAELSVKTFDQGEEIGIRVSDKGIGISKEDQKKIFDKFYRVHTGNIHEVKGFGLGLSYVKRMVELFGGRIELQSKKGQGTSINIYLKKIKNNG